MSSDPDELEPILRLLAVGPHRGHARSTGVRAELLDELVFLCRGGSLDGQLLEAVLLGHLDLTPGQLEYVADHHRAVMAHALRVEGLALAVISELGVLGMQTRLMKGVHLANSVYPDPAFRSFADVDLLVEPGHFTASIAAIESLGGQRLLPEVAPGHDERFAKEAALLLDGLALDLHRTLIDGPYGERLDIVRMFGRRHEVNIGSVTVDGLHLEDAYLHAALTAGAADDPPRHVTLRDLLELEGVLGDGVTEAAEAAQSMGLATPVARAIRLMNSRLRPDDSPRLLGWASAHRPSPAEQRILSAYLGSGRSYRRQLAMVRALPRWGDRVRYLRDLAFPQETYRAARKWSRTEHLANAVRRLTGR